MLTIRRTYPQPDSPQPNLGPRERALAVFKYLLGLEPEQAIRHPLFPCVEHSYVQAVRRVTFAELPPSLVTMLTGETVVPEAAHVEDPGL
jgi:hypothetical protein